MTRDLAYHDYEGIVLGSLFSNPECLELRSNNLVWPALLRKFDCIDPSYRN